MRRAFLPALVALCLVVLPAAYSPPPVPQGAFTAYTPTVSAESGTFTTVSAQGRYQQTGKRVDFWLQVNVTTVGTAGGAVLASVPVTPASGANYQAAGRDGGVGGKVLQGSVLASGNLRILTYDAAAPAVSGSVLILSGFYEAL